MSGEAAIEIYLFFYISLDFGTTSLKNIKTQFY